MSHQSPVPPHTPKSDTLKSKAGKARHVPSVNSVTTINEDGSRFFLHPADVRGWFTRWRRYSGLALIAFYVLLPWIKVGGYPAVFLDVAERRFHFFGFTLAAQDVWLLFFGVSGLGFALFFLTALFGRLWCGWSCPHTVYLDQVYRRIERMIEGDAQQRRQLDLAPMSAGKFTRRLLKHSLYILASLCITHIFLSYFVSLPEVWRMMGSAPGEHWGLFLFVFIAAGILYFNFAWFREQLCIVICPYGRLQSALTDDHSLVIGYDATRGEPRGKLGTPDAGACVACNRCVQVCPTGIDIRHGLQMECIGCAACIDACDEIMEKVDRPKGLIRYDSFVGLGGKITQWIRPRTVVYGILLLIGVAVAAFAFSTVKPAGFMVMRMSSAAYFVTPDDVRNQFMVRLLNKRNEPVTFTVSLNGLPDGAAQNGFADSVTVPPLGEQVSPLVLHVDRSHYTGPFKFMLSVQDQSRTFTLAREVEFLGPDAQLLPEEDHEKSIKR